MSAIRPKPRETEHNLLQGLVVNKAGSILGQLKSPFLNLLAELPASESVPHSWSIRSEGRQLHGERTGSR